MSRIAKTSRAVLCLTFACALSQPAAGADYKVFLLGGQSNIAGRAAASGLPPELQAAQGDVLLYEGSALGVLAPKSDGTFGPEITFGRTIADALPDDNFAFIKYGVGGTDLYNDWDPSTGGTYSTFRTKVTNGLAALQSGGNTTEIVGMLWVQGERDAKANRTTAQYEVDLVEFIADVRTRYGADLPFYLSRLSSLQTNITPGQLAEIRPAQANVAAGDANATMIDTDTFGMKSDNLHFNASGQQDLGNAFAAAYLGSGPGPDPEPGAIARWDIDSNNPGAWRTQEGFASVGANGNSNATKSPIAVTDNGITLTMDGAWKLDNDRVPGSYPALAGQEMESMLRDFVTAPDTLFGSLAFELAGLAGETDYVVRVWSYDARDTYNGRIIDWRDSQGAVLGSITMNHADPANAYADLAVTSDADGKVTLLADGQNFNFWVNGIEVIPEPASLLLMIPCAVAFLRRRRATIDAKTTQRRIVTPH